MELESSVPELGMSPVSPPRNGPPITRHITATQIQRHMLMSAFNVAGPLLPLNVENAPAVLVSHDETVELTLDLLDEEKRENYRKEGRENDAKNVEGVLCYRSKGRAILARCARALNTLENANPAFTTDLGGFVRYTRNIQDFFDFVVYESGQSSRDWGGCRNLARPRDLERIRRDMFVRLTAAQLFENLERDGETTVQGGIQDVIIAIRSSAGWISRRVASQYPVFAGGHIAYPPSENDQNWNLPAAIGSLVDAQFASVDRSRRVVAEFKKHKEIRGAYDSYALLQMLTGALGVGAQIGLIAAGVDFGIYWFKYVDETAIHVHKYLPSDQLVRFDNIDDLIKFLAHIAFFVSDPLPPSPVDIDSPSPPEAGSVQLPPSAQDRRLQVLPGQTALVTEFWQEVYIEGQQGQRLRCIRLKEGLDSATRKAVTGELEPESDEDDY